MNITDELAQDLIAWGAWFDRGLNMDNPGSSIWAEGEYDQFLMVGELLLESLREQLGQKFIVKKAF